MKNKLLFLSIILFLLTSCTFEFYAWANLAQQLPAETRRITVYQGINLAWKEELFEIHLQAGENRLSLTQEGMEKGRITVHPLQKGLTIERLEDRETHYELVLSAEEEGNYRLLTGFFVGGMDWEESYLGILEGASSLQLFPAVYIQQQNNREFEKVSLQWLLGKPALELFPPQEAMMEKVMASELERAPSPPAIEITTHKVSEYQLFALSGEVTLAAWSTNAFFPEKRSFDYQEKYRLSDERTLQVLTFKNEGDPLPPGNLLLWDVENGWCERLLFPGARQNEQLELVLEKAKILAKRREVAYRRLKTRFNQEKEVVGFISQKEVLFELENPTPDEITLEIEESLPPGEVKLPEDWEFKNGAAWKTVLLSPGEKKEITLVYQFEEEI